MIVIKEDKPRKLSGLSSLFISFDYNQNVVNSIKSLCALYVYDKKTHIWEIPLKDSYKLIEELSLLDEISIISLVEEKNVSETNLDVSTFKTKPFDYQVEGIKYGLTHNKWLLLDTMGLGKTLQMIYLAQELKRQNKIEHCFIICGVNSLKTNWKKEIQKHSDLSCIILGERVNSKGKIVYDGVQERAKQLKEKIDEFFIITNIETLRSEEIVEAFKTSVNKFDMIICDEIHTTKDSQSKQGHNLLKLDAEYKVGLTGTLVLNNALDCYVPLSWINVDNSTLTNFKNYYCNYSDLYSGQIVGFKNLDVLKEELDSCSLRRTKDLLELPEKTIINEYVDMNDSHTSLYDSVVKGIKDEVDLVNINANNLLAMTTRLRQATSCPQLLSTKEFINSKIERCKELVEELQSQDESVVIFSMFKETCYDLAEKLKEYNPFVITGDTSDSETSNMIDIFQSSEKKIIIATIQKLSTGVTLNKARYMIFVDLPWTPALYNQSCDRIHRIGSKRPVFIYNLICVNTIDEHVLEVVNDKQALFDYIIDDKVSESSLKRLQKYISSL